jgi:hypothetical protein
MISSISSDRVLDLLEQQFGLVHAAVPRNTAQEEAMFQLRQRFEHILRKQCHTPKPEELEGLYKRLADSPREVMKVFRQRGLDEELTISIGEELESAFQRVKCALEHTFAWGAAEEVSFCPGIAYSPWQDWDTRSYLGTFFAELGPDTFATLRFLARELQYFRDQPAERALDFGCGPTPIASLAAVPYAREIHLADFIPANVEEVQRWIDADPDAFSWDHAIAGILKLEGTEPTVEHIAQRATKLRSKAHTLLCDAALPYPLHRQTEPYPLVLSMYCADSATSSKETWRQYIRNICTLVAPTGRILIAALRNCCAYRLGEHAFPSANIDEADLEAILLDVGFSRNTLHIEVSDVPECAQEGFTSVIFARAIMEN